MVVESQARLITSNSVLGQVIQDTHLDKDPEFGGGSGGVLGKVLDLFGLQTRATASPALGQTTALDALNHHINVKKTDRSFIVDIDVWSYDPAKAAMLANAISRADLAEAKNSQAIAARRATSDLSGRLKELQDRLRTAENALALYKAQNNFVGTQDTLITDQQLIASNQRLAAARAATLDAQARYDQIEASRRNAGDAGAIPEALQSPTLGNLRAQYAEARRKLAEMTAELGPLHPSLPRWKSRSRTCIGRSTRKSTASPSRQKTISHAPATMKPPSPAPWKRRSARACNSARHRYGFANSSATSKRVAMCINRFSSDRAKPRSRKASIPRTPASSAKPPCRSGAPSRRR
jgi:uncharacterized protein involved in exopolysaccharide biosynthesis